MKRRKTKMELKSLLRGLDEYLSNPKTRNPNFDDTNYRYEISQLKRAYDVLAKFVSRGQEDPLHIYPNDVTSVLQSLDLIAHLNNFEIEWSKADKSGIPAVTKK
jgi:hypothetical protein